MKKQQVDELVRSIAYSIGQANYGKATGTGYFPSDCAGISKYVAEAEMQKQQVPTKYIELICHYLRTGD